MNPLRRILDFLYPRDCFFCRQPVDGDHGHICLDCFSKISLRRNPCCSVCGAESHLPGGPDFICAECMRHPPAYDRTVVATRYGGAVKDLVHTFKYGRGLWLTDDLVLLMQAAYVVHYQDLGRTFDLLVPVPMLPKKRRRRGYNQAEVLARALAKSLEIPCRTDILRRVATGVASQTQLHREERFANAADSYRLAKPAAIQGNRVLLIDDVMTTGATLNVCAGSLLKAGASSVSCLVLSRGTMV